MANYNYWPKYGFENYSIILPLERSFDQETSTVWMQKNWLHSMTVSVVYVVLIFGGQKIMESRKPYALDTPLFLWNLLLAVFSTLGFIRMTPEWVWSIMSPNSLSYSICVASFAQSVTGFWTEQFAMSKVAELFDTAFIVARKRPLLFLHWYHHISVLIYTWHAYKDHTASGRWFIWMNYGVHMIMYSYYAIRALRLRTPKFVAMIITFLQIAQMVVGVTIGISVYRIKSQGLNCQQTWENLYLNLGMYFSYFLLFCNFFYHAYLKKNNRYAVADTKPSKDEAKMPLTNGNAANGVTTRRKAQKAE